MPGVVVAAETHTEELQRRVLESLPPPATERVTVVATCHTEVGTWLWILSVAGAAAH